MDSGLFGFWPRFSSVTGFFKPAPSPKPRQKPKILAAHRYIFSVNALGLDIVIKNWKFSLGFDEPLNTSHWHPSSINPQNLCTIFDILIDRKQHRNARETPLASFCLRWMSISPKSNGLPICLLAIPSTNQARILPNQTAAIIRKLFLAPGNPLLHLAKNPPTRLASVLERDFGLTWHKRTNDQRDLATWSSYVM